MKLCIAIVVAFLGTIAMPLEEDRFTKGGMAKAGFDGFGNENTAGVSYRRYGGGPALLSF